MSQFAKEDAAYQPVDHQGKACEGAACAGARVSRTGKIKTRCMNKSNAVLGATLGLSLIHIFGFWLHAFAPY